jgi:hypothetical protein
MLSVGCTATVAAEQEFVPSLEALADTIGQVNDQ